MEVTRLSHRHQDARREKRSRGTEIEPCYLLPPGVAFWPKFEGVRADRATATDGGGGEENGDVMEAEDAPEAAVSNNGVAVLDVGGGGKAVDDSGRQSGE